MFCHFFLHAIDLVFAYVYCFEILNHLTFWSQSWKVKCTLIFTPSDGICDVDYLSGGIYLYYVTTRVFMFS